MKRNETMSAFSIVLSFLVISDISDGARILGIFQTPSISHQVVFGSLMQELARRGHHVTVMTTDPAFERGETPENYTEIDVHDVSYNHFAKLWDGIVWHQLGELELLRIMFENLIKIYEKQMETEEMQEILRNEKEFDLLFLETAVNGCFDIARKQNIPIIEINSMPAPDFLYQKFGVATHPVIYPAWLQKNIHNLSLWEKLTSIFKTLYMSYITKVIIGPAINKVDPTNFDHIDMLFVNSFPIWDHNRAVPPNVIYLGGLHLKPEKNLPSELQTYLDSSRNGIIYMSFGCNVDPTVLSTEKIYTFCKVFSKIPYDILWKWNGDKLFCKPDNVRISKWLPQSDILRHPKVKLFITQAGLQSTDESITAGVPLLAFPMLGDQWYNAEMYVKHKIGLTMDFKTFTEVELDTNIRRIIEDGGSYRKNLKKLNATLYDQPQSPLERAVWWTEYVLRHGGAKHLRSPMANISWSEYLMLDVIAVVSFISIFTVFCLFFVCKTVFKISLQPNKLKKS